VPTFIRAWAAAPFNWERCSFRQPTFGAIALRQGLCLRAAQLGLVARRLSESRQANWISQSGLHKNDPALNGRGHEALLGYRHFPAQGEGSSKRNRIAGMRWVKENLSRILRDFFPRHSGKSEGGRG